MANSEINPPTRETLESVLDDVRYVIDECLAYVSWIAQLAPQLNNVIMCQEQSYHLRRVSNAILEGNLMFLRKLNEFFNARPKRRGFDAYAADFQGYGRLGWFLSPDESADLHTRVGHITYSEALQGKKTWEILDMIKRALERSIDFMDYAAENFYACNAVKQEEYRHFRDKMRQQLMSLAIKPNKNVAD